MTASTRIRPVLPDDLEPLTRMSRETFAATFADGNRPEDLAAYMDRAFAPDALRGELDRPGSAFFFIESGETPAGYLKLNTGEDQTEQVDDRALEIERIYVSSGFQGLGLGKALLEFAIARARKQDLHLVWLGVWEKNQNAIGFYRRFGFEPFGSHDFAMGDDMQTDILMRLSLAQESPAKTFSDSRQIRGF